MAWWQWLIDVAGVALLLVLLYGLALVLRRRLLARDGGTFELSHRPRSHDDQVGIDRPEDSPPDESRGWVLGLGRYSGETLEWFRIFSLAPRPKRTWPRDRLGYAGRRVPEGAERSSLYPDHVVICCSTVGGEVELAMSEASLTGFQAWLEARPPGTDWNR